MTTNTDRLAALERQRHYQSAAAMAYMGLFLGDAEHPDFWPLVNQAYNFMAPNPDDTYYVAPLDGDGVYRLSGFRGSVRMVDVQIGSGDLFTRGGALGPNLATYDLDTLQLDKDGAFDVILSTERPAGHRGNWWKLGKGATYILVRQVAYDWKEIDGRYAIERLDRPAARPRLREAQLEDNLRAMSTWAEHWSAIGEKWVASYRTKGFVNKVFLHELTDIGGITAQKYIEGEFELEADEALIYETPIPARCRYWNVQLTDMLWSTLDYTNRQTSLNGHSARLDSDGRFRAVIAGSDPGVPNWLDSAGYRNGAILGRWTECSDYPVPTVTRVKLADLRRHLPVDTPTVSAEQRDRELRERRRDAQLRRRW